MTIKQAAAVFIPPWCDEVLKLFPWCLFQSHTVCALELYIGYIVSNGPLNAAYKPLSDTYTWNDKILITFNVF